MLVDSAAANLSMAADIVVGAGDAQFAEVAGVYVSGPAGPVAPVLDVKKVSKEACINIFLIRLLF